MRKMQFNFGSILFVLSAILILGSMTAMAMDNAIPNLSNFGNVFHGVDASGAINLQGVHPDIIFLSGYYGNMHNYVNIFFAQGETRGFTATTSGGGSGGGGGDAPT